MRHTQAVALMCALAACETTETIDGERCALDASLVQTSGAPGDTIRAEGGPFVDLRDGAVFVNGVRATVTQVNDGDLACLDCLNCRLESACTACDDECTGNGNLDLERAAECFDEADGFCAQCDFSLEFTVPDVPAGPTSVQIITTLGTSSALPFVVDAAAVPTGDTSGTPTVTTADTSVDTGASDTGPDTGAP